jgi:thiosulfate/3-mercaptopyruvate sulfurtransferase
MGSLITADELRARPHDASAIVEIGIGSSPDAGPAVIAGARRVDWQALLWDDERRALASRERLEERLADLGVQPGDAFVVYGDPVQFGTYAVWALEVAGVTGAVLLDGGAEGWRAPAVGGAVAASANGAGQNGGAVEAAGVVGARPTAEIQATADDRVCRDAVAAAIDDPDIAIVDARSDEEYAGERVSPPEFPVDHGAAVAGRVPGALHLPYRDLLDEHGRFRSADEINARVEEAGVEPGQRVVIYCRLGHRATLTWFALRQIAGRDDVQVYDGSWTEWGSLVGAPVER